MMRYLALLPLAVLIGVPFLTRPSLPVLLIGAVAACFCTIGVLRLWLLPVTVGGAVALIDYALAASLASGGSDVVGAAACGLALLFLLDLTEFPQRFRGAEIATAVTRSQIAFWLGRAAAATAAVAVLSLAAAVSGQVIPVLGRPVVTGLGAAIAFVGAMRGAIVRGRGKVP